MVRTTASVGPENTSDYSPSQHFTSLISVQSDVTHLRNSKPPRHRRHHSLFSSSSRPNASIDSSTTNQSSAGTTPSHVLTKTSSGKVLKDWRLRELWHTKPQSETKITSHVTEVIDTDSQASDKLEVVEKSVTTLRSSTSDTTEVKKISSGIWRIGELWHTRRLSEKTATHSGRKHPDNAKEETIPYVVNATESTTTVSVGTSHHSTHFTSLGVYVSARSSSDELELSDYGSSPPEVSQSKISVPLSTRWREIQGANNWEDVLYPLDLELRKEIIRYGEFAQMTYDNFEFDSRSKYAGSARYPKQKMFDKLYKPDTGYQVTRYLYATCSNPLPSLVQSSLSSERWDAESNWMGFVAVTTDKKEIERLGRRDILVAWRGTVRTIEWLVDAQIQLTSMTVAPDPQGGGASKPVELSPKVEKGFWTLYNCKRSSSKFNEKSASEQVIQEIARLLTLYKGENLSITITGHSLGGALATLTAYEVAERGLNKHPTSSGAQEIIPVTCFTFGSPRVGDAVFKKRFEELHLKAFRVVNIRDLVPKSIGGFHSPWGETFKHVGVELQVDHRNSTYMKHTRDPVDWHNMECYLHHVDGYQGPKSTAFKLMTGRDHALINKAADLLKDLYCVLPFWWQIENKGLVLSPEGRWVELNRDAENTPSLENQEGFI